MPLKSGKGSIRTNIKELMSGIESKSRAKAVRTIMAKHGISKNEAMFRQAVAIAKSIK